MPILVIAQSELWTGLLDRVRGAAEAVEQGALSLLFCIAVALIGWGVAIVVSRLTRWLLRLARFNQGVAELFGPRPGAAQEPAELAAWAVYWTVLVVSILLALDVLGLSVRTAVLDRLGDVAPRIVVAAVLFGVGVLIAMFLGALTRRFFATAGIAGARLRGQLVTGVLTGFAALLALEQLGFAAQFVMVLGGLAAAAVALALGLAFGLGCRDLARDFVVEYLRSLDEAGPKRPA
jgi:hypothetical protein